MRPIFGFSSCAARLRIDLMRALRCSSLHPNLDHLDTESLAEVFRPGLTIGPMIRFKGVLTPTPRGGGGTLVTIPREVAAKLGLKGMPKVQAVIGGHPYRGSLMPMGDGTYCLGVLKSIQEAAGVGQGDSITIELALDTAPRTVEVPADLSRALSRDKKAAAAWEALSYTNKKEAARAIEEAKRPETRERRLAGIIAKLRGR